jgi:poly-gamma-glutamate capsule biosynthesis protein CapA/YwtB (metallophosphatase superfamily)
MKKYILILALMVLFAGCAAPELKISKAQEPGDGSFEMAVVGDIMPGRHMASLIDEKGIEYIFQDVAPVLKECGIVFGNLETPLVHEISESTLKQNGKKSIHLLTEEKAADGLKYAGFNIVSLANNHSLDYGQEGINQTLEILKSRNIAFNGVMKGDLSVSNEPSILEVNGVKVGFLCYSEVSHWKFQATPSKYGTMPSYFKEMKRDIKNARPKVDILVIYLHWGKEGQEVQKFQYKNSKKILDYGADLLISSHTHLFQDIEKYKGKYIFYGLGNFVFDMPGEETKSSAIVKLKIQDKKITGAKIIPVYIKDYRTELVTDGSKVTDFLLGLKLKNLTLEDLY